MATMKRRIVYLSDEQWADLQRQAQEGESTVSALIRTGLAWMPKGYQPTSEPTVEYRVNRTAKERQANRDAILRKINRGG